MQLKFKYIRANKQMYEPFRSIDIQEITLEIVKKVINTDELIRKKVLLKMFFIHDMMS